jgi:hypothetical protein
MAWVRQSADSHGVTSVWLPTKGPDGRAITTGDEIDIWTEPSGGTERAEIGGALYWSCDSHQVVCHCCRSTYIEDGVGAAEAAEAAKRRACI